MNADVIVIGAGLAGLACALTLRDCGLETLIVEASDGVGGRVRTDHREGFLLDRGFQVLQTWYPEAREMLDYRRLDLRPFYPGALVRCEGRLRRVSDIWRRPRRMPEMLMSPVGSLSDKLRLAGLRSRCLRGDLEALYGRPETTALEHLQRLGFSSRMIDRFFKPFFSGVFFEPDLGVSSRTFEFVFRAFALGDTALPGRGMGEIPAQLAAGLPRRCIRLGSKAERIDRTEVVLESGERFKGRAVVIATEGAETARLLHQPKLDTTAHRGTTCFYFGSRQAPIRGNYLVLNGEGRGRVNSLLFPSNLSEHYAPPGRHLITVNVHGASENPDTLETRIRKELGAWLGEQVREWKRIAVYRLPHALPSQRPPVQYPGTQELRRSEWVWSCGEYQTAPSIQWALHTGRRAGREVAEALKAAPNNRTLDTRHPAAH